MTKAQREILIVNVKDAGDTYAIQGIEYPAYTDNFAEGVCLKITTRQIEGDMIDVDYYDYEGRTVTHAHRSFFARSV